ncbi:tetratricopeptide repeat protein [Marivirga sp. S37H4]|uniref:Tetratricopeptide repeat protein n=1 Tax=Marivirga aurantiaca TaxID=2802615 RepID=A0A934WV87_9BACT|nr:tetratricopeptide repeat protein [Marivirga aurantiaca]MBK6263648.1 tetratricopeptide repeat protein [Marivirga aurantiaca]
MKDADYILFEDYLSGNLSHEELKAFELRLKADPEFSHAFELYKETSGFLENKYKNEDELISFKGNLKNISENYFNKNNSSNNRSLWWKVAAAACILLFVGLYFFQQFSRPGYQEFANYQAISLTERGAENELLFKAEEAFNAGKYQEAEKYFEEILEDDDNNHELKLYRAISLIETENYLKAEEILDEISNSTSVYQYEAVWYKALSRLKQEKYQESAEILKTIPKEEAKYAEARKLLDRLE